MKFAFWIICLIGISTSAIAADCAQGISTMEKIGQIKDVLRCLAAESTRTNEQILSISQQADKAAKMLDGGTVQQSNAKIYIGNSCFSVHQLVRCLLPSGSHLTWFDNVAECGMARGTIEGQVAVLSGCL